MDTMDRKPSSIRERVRGWCPARSSKPVRGLETGSWWVRFPCVPARLRLAVGFGSDHLRDLTGLLCQVEPNLKTPRVLGLVPPGRLEGATVLVSWDLGTVGPDCPSGRDLSQITG